MPQKLYPRHYKTRLSDVEFEIPSSLQLYTGGGFDYVGFNLDPEGQTFLCIVKEPNNDAIPLSADEPCYIQRVDTMSSNNHSVKFDSLCDAIATLVLLQKVACSWDSDLRAERAVIRQIGRAAAAKLVKLAS